MCLPQPLFQIDIRSVLQQINTRTVYTRRHDNGSGIIQTLGKIHYFSGVENAENAIDGMEMEMEVEKGNFDAGIALIQQN